MQRKMPDIEAVHVIATRPLAQDLPRMISTSPLEDTARTPVYVVRIRLGGNLSTGHSGGGFDLYVGDARISKFYGWPGGIYFKIYDREFFERHKDHTIRLSIDGQNFKDTGQVLEEPVLAPPSILEASPLPTQESVLRIS